MKITLAVLLCSFLGGYLGYAVRAFLEPPVLMPRYGMRTWAWFAAHLRLTAGPSVRTGIMRRMVRGSLAQVACFSEYAGGVVLLEWQTETPSLGIYPSLETMRKIHEHPGTVITFDPRPEGDVL